MIGTSLVRLAAVAFVGIGLGVGCASTPEESPTTDTNSEWSESPSTDSTAMRDSTPVPELQTVYFAFDRSDIREDARAKLRSNAEVINGMERTVTVEGHADERGSTEYNLALGERRANAVKRYLVDLGVASSKLRTVSFGEARPAVPGHDENAWRYNRRVEFKGSN